MDQEDHFVSTTEMQIKEAVLAAEPVSSRTLIKVAAPIQVNSPVSAGKNDNQSTTFTKVSTTGSCSTKVDLAQTIAKHSMHGSSVVQLPIMKCLHLPAPADTMIFTPDTVLFPATTPTYSQKDQGFQRNGSIMKGSTPAPANIPPHRIPNGKLTGTQAGFHHLPVAFPTSRTIFLAPLPPSSSRKQSNQATLKNRGKVNTVSPSKVAPMPNRFKAIAVSVDRRPLPPCMPLNRSLRKPVTPSSAIHTRSHSLSQSSNNGVENRTKLCYETKELSKPFSGGEVCKDHLPPSSATLQRMLHSPFRSTITSVSRPLVRNIKVRRIPTGQFLNNTLSPSESEQKFSNSHGKLIQETFRDEQGEGDHSAHVEFDYRRFLRPVRSRVRESEQRHTIISTVPENKFTVGITCSKQS